MLEKIVIRNFQCHERLELRLDPRVTTIVGPSDSGKSAVIRAIRWAAQNRPSGDAHIRDGARSASVTLEVDGHTVERARGAAENVYRLDGKEFSAVGKDVPAEVAAVLALDDVNFQGQHDGPYWLSLSPPEVSRRLNEVVDLSLIDSTLAALAAGARRARAERDVVGERLEAARAEREALRPAKEADKELRAVETLAEERGVTAARAEAADILVAGGRAHLAELRGLEGALEAGERARSAGEDWAAAREREEALGAIVAAAAEAHRAASAPVPDLSGLEAMAEALEGAREKAGALESLLGEAGRHRGEVQNLTASLRNNKKELKERMGDTCALCGQAVRL